MRLTKRMCSVVSKGKGQMLDPSALADETARRVFTLYNQRVGGSADQLIDFEDLIHKAGTNTDPFHRPNQPPLFFLNQPCHSNQTKP